MIPTLVLLSLGLLTQKALEIDPPDLARRPDLIGKAVAVDGRVALYQFHPGRGFDEILLKRSDVVLRLPTELRFRQAPSQRVVRAEGILRRDGDRLILEVQSLQLLPEDRQRLETGLAALPPGELTRRRAWAAWAEHRARLYNDPELLDRARQVQTEILWSEAERPAARSPEATLELARRGREAQLLEPVPSTLAHRAFLALRRQATTADELARLAQQVAEFFPDAKTPIPKPPAGFDDWAARYRQSGEAAYRDAPAELLPALNRLLYADLIQAELETRLAQDPASGLDLAERAVALLPDRPALADALRTRGLEASVNNVTRLRRLEAFDLARSLEQNGQAALANQVRRQWLDHYRTQRLAPGDADGRAALAEDYLNVLKDRPTAITLLQEALALDPNLPSAREQFRRLGFQLRDGQWVESQTATPTTAASAATAGDDPLLGLTPEEVEAQLGTPDRRSQIVTQGDVRIQWIYGAGQRSTQYVNFQRRPGAPPTVIGRYTTP
ncbi:MAG: hypothetical protein KatS3mg108_3092 [Isosphaeraceae bacterium]|jgi:hypothetical protein|nr:MAG: hypothetical protein KatS3mg108_3092 [Isosphaeraceae bacterium]